MVLWYVSRPIKKGIYFRRDRVKKRSLGRHYRLVVNSASFTREQEYSIVNAPYLIRLENSVASFQVVVIG